MNTRLTIIILLLALILGVLVASWIDARAMWESVK